MNKVGESWPHHKDDILLVVEHKTMTGERYVTGGYYDADTNTFDAYGFDFEKGDIDYKITYWLPIPEQAYKYINNSN